MKEILNIVQVVIAILLIVVILLQQRGTGLASVFGGEGNVFRTKRGLEKILFIATVILGILFLGTAFLTLLI